MITEPHEALNTTATHVISLTHAGLDVRQVDVVPSGVELEAGAAPPFTFKEDASDRLFDWNVRSPALPPQSLQIDCAL